ncbi:unnamed protein product [Prorocentrum cordatum]|uniref:Uncharacterized protein n=1 Tax=Prorocentrum cordatum TaxID=2364126 RepID=A0ABN9PTK2_9DINO|nr:unnamed protein product [Polarella glacialis]
MPENWTHCTLHAFKAEHLAPVRTEEVQAALRELFDEVQAEQQKQVQQKQAAASSAAPDPARVRVLRSPVPERKEKEVPPGTFEEDDEERRRRRRGRPGPDRRASRSTSSMAR